MPNRQCSELLAPAGKEWIGRNLSGSDDVAEMLAQKETSAITSWPDRIKRITGSAKAHRIPWVVSVGFPINAGQAAMMTHLTLGGIFSGLSLLAGIAIAWMLSGRIVGPLQQLQRDALSLASGDLTHRTTVKKDDLLPGARWDYRPGESVSTCSHRNSRAMCF